MAKAVPDSPTGVVPSEAVDTNGVRRRGRRQPLTVPMCAEPRPLSVSKLISEALSSPLGGAGMSLAMLKSKLAAAGYDVDKNNGRIKLALKTMVSKGTLVQTKGTGDSGSFKLNKKPSPDTLKTDSDTLKPDSDSDTLKPDSDTLKPDSDALKPDSDKPQDLDPSQDQSPPTEASVIKKPKRTAKKATPTPDKAKVKGAKVRPANPRAGKPKSTTLNSNPRKATSKM